MIGPEETARQAAIQAGLAPRLDYQVLAEITGGVIRECAPSPAALRGTKRRRAVVSLLANLRAAVRVTAATPVGGTTYSTGETWGLPVALVLRLLRRSCVHVVYAHRVFSPAWARLFRRLRGFMRVDGWICVTNHQADLLRQTLGRGASPVIAISQGVDTLFYDPDKAKPAPQEPYILSVGAEMRDYPLLLAAVRNIETPVVLKASSTWMSQLRETPGAMPRNVTLLQQRLSYVELRDLYGGAALVVVPLYDTPQAAGITTILEAMAMGKPVVVTRSSGLPDGLVSGSNCVIIEPDAGGLARAITALLNDPAQREALAANGRRFVLGTCTLEQYAQKISDFLDAVAVNRSIRALAR